MSQEINTKSKRTRPRSQKKSKVEPLTDDEEGTFNVEAITDHRKYKANSEWKFRTKWEGLGTTYNTWEPAKHFFVSPLAYRVLLKYMNDNMTAE
jgi:hypothetical protein